VWTKSPSSGDDKAGKDDYNLHKNAELVCSIRTLQLGKGMSPLCPADECFATHPSDTVWSNLHSIHTSDRLWAGLSCDLVTEQTLMKSVKSCGGLMQVVACMKLLSEGHH